MVARDETHVPPADDEQSLGGFDQIAVHQCLERARAIDARQRVPLEGQRFLSRASGNQEHLRFHQHVFRIAYSVFRIFAFSLTRFFAFSLSRFLAFSLTRFLADSQDSDFVVAEDRQRGAIQPDLHAGVLAHLVF